MSFPNTIYGSEGELIHNSADETVPVGTKMVIEDGRVFRFSEVAGTVLVIGSLNQGAVPSANHTTEVIDTLAAGVVLLTGVGSTGADFAVNLGVNGYIYTDNATTLPLARIKDNTVLSSGGTGTVTLYTITAQAIAAANTVSYFENPWRDVFIHDSPATAVYTGVAKVAITADQFGWLQTAGPCTVLYSSTTTAISAVNDPVCGAPGVAGSVQGLASGTTETNPIVGFQLGLVEGDTEQNAIFLTIE